MAVISAVIFSFAPPVFSKKIELGSPIIKNFTRTDYQAGTQNWQIIQDSSGIIYVGNNKGLLIFDGVNWDLVKLPNATIVRSLAICNDGTIYIGAQNEIGYLSTKENGEVFYKSLLNLLPEENQTFDDVWKIFCLEEEVLFFTEKFILSFKNNEFSIVNPDEGKFENFFHVNNQIFIQDQQKGLFELKNQALSLISDNTIFKKERIIGFFEMDSTLYFLAQKSGFFTLNNNEVKAVKGTNIELLKGEPYSVLKSNAGNIYVGTATNGLFVLNKELLIVEHYNSENGLKNNTVLSLFEDKSENIWLGLDNGLDFIETKTPFRFIDYTHNIKGTGYTAIKFNGYLYLGTNQGLYISVEPYDATKKVIFKPVEGISGQVWNLQEINGRLIASMHEGAAEIFKDKVVYFSRKKGSWGFQPLGKYLLQGTYSGFYLFDLSKSSNPSVQPIFLEGFNESARIFEQDEYGNIWVSHAYKGLYKIVLTEDKTKIESITKFEKENGLPTDLYINVAKIKNEVVFTTPFGIYKFNYDKNSFEEHTAFEELLGTKRNVHRLIEDGKGNIWFSVDEEFGVLKIDEKGAFLNYEIQYFNASQKDLVEGFEFVYYLSDGNILIGTEKGFSSLNIKAPLNPENSSKTMVRAVKVTSPNDTIFSFGGSTNLQAKTLKFKHNQNNFLFSFAIPIYEGNENIKYRYKLKGFNKEFSEWTSKTEKEYTNLSPGKYTFFVEAKDSFGRICEGAEYSFKINKPWYLSIYALFAYVILLGSFLIGWVFYISAREQKKTFAFKKEQVKKLAQKEKEFKQEVEKSEKEVSNLLNEKLQAEVNFKNSQLASTTMHLVQKSEILQKLKTELNQLSKQVPSDLKRKVDSISRELDADFKLDNSWEQFELYFDQVQENFFKNLREKHPELTPKDQKLCAYLRMNLSTKEIAPLLNISVRGVEISRYRLRKKLNIDSNTNLVEFIMNV
jgi:ligand-binding sensor domain-containing protein/DNA-binding CsgD family transcriptional regulator